MQKYLVSVSYNGEEVSEEFEGRENAVAAAKYLLHTVRIIPFPEEMNLLYTAFRALLSERSASVHVDIHGGIDLPDARVTFRKLSDENSLLSDPSHPIVYLKHELTNLLQGFRYSMDEHIYDLVFRIEQPFEACITVEFNFSVEGYIWGISFPTGKTVAGDYSIDMSNRDEDYIVSEAREAAEEIIKQFKATSRAVYKVTRK